MSSNQRFYQLQKKRAIARKRTASSYALAVQLIGRKFRQMAFALRQRRCISIISARIGAVRFIASRALGQPIHETHPHLVNKDELTPGIPTAEYHDRRRRLALAMGPQSVAVVPGYGLRYVSNGIFYPFKQSTNMLYLTGFGEPDCGCTIESVDRTGNHFHFTMYVQPTDRHTEIWDGPRAGVDAACTHFGADAAYPVDLFERQLRMLNQSDTVMTIYSDLPLTNQYAHSLLEDTNIRTKSMSATATGPVDPNISTRFAHYKSKPILTSAIESSSSLSPSSTVMDSARDFLMDWVRRGNRTNAQTVIRPLKPIIDELRLIKTDHEVRVMREAGRIAGRSFVEAMRGTKPSMTESQIAATLEYHARMQGASGLSYVPVVASGKNANIIHYVLNQQILKDGDLLLVDAGAEYGGYVSDITRTWPISGKFTNAQRELYTLVLDVQRYMIRKCVDTQHVSLNDLQTETCEMIRDGLSALFRRQVSRKELDIVYPHHVGHWLGMDVHDTGSISRSRKLGQNMVVTIEPGVYIPDLPEYPQQYRGMGVRIEDDVVVGGKSTGYAPIVLTAEAPKETDDIEAVMSGVV